MPRIRYQQCWLAYSMHSGVTEIIKGDYVDYTKVTIIVLVAIVSCCTSGSLSKHSHPNGSDPLVYTEALTLYKRGLKMAKDGDFIRAEQYLAASISRGYPSEKVLPILINVCISESRLGTAMKYALPTLQRNPKNWRLRFVVASTFLGLKQPKQARRELDRVIKDAPQYAPAYYLLGIILRDEFKDHESAAQSFHKYILIEPNGFHSDEILSWLREYETQKYHSPSFIKEPQEMTL